MTRTKTTAAMMLGALLALAPAGLAQAQDWNGAIRALNEATTNYRWGQILMVQTGALSQGGELPYWVIPVTSWGTITATARCDANCTDIDLIVLDANGQIIAQDVAPDTHPIVTFQPPWTGYYRVVTRMYGCAATCAVSTAIFQQ